MANIKSAKKDVKQTIKKTPKNHEYRATVKNSIKNCEKAILANDKNTAEEIYKNVQKNIDKACSRKIIKKNTADRQKSRLSQKIKALQK